MLKHIVILHIKAELDRETLIPEICSRLEAMPSIIDEILSLEIGVNCVESPASGDIVLITTHENIETYLQYQEHPHHLKIKDYLFSITDTRTVVDFETI